MSDSIRIDTPLLVCGVGRSGTSLLQAMLAAHPEIVFPPETQFFRRYVADPVARNSLEQGTLEDLADALDADERLARSGFSSSDLLAEETAGDIDLLRVHRRLLVLSAEREGGHYVGDKDPKNLEHLPALHAAFPGAFVLHVVRDPRDVVLSRTKADWSSHRPWWMHALVLREQLRRGRQRGPALFTDRYIEVRYEKLVADPERVLRDLVRRIGLPWSAEMLAFDKQADRLVDPSELQWKSALFGPLLSDNTEKWRRELTPFQVRWTETVCCESFAGDEYGAAEDKGLAPHERVALGAAPALRTAAAWAYDWLEGRRGA